jgi:hypothetical protein
MYKVKVGRFTYRENLNQWEAQRLKSELKSVVKNVKVVRG